MLASGMFAADGKGRTPVILAANSGKVEVVHALLGAHASVNARTKNSETALSIASRKGHAGVVQLLKAAGAKE